MVHRQFISWKFTVQKVWWLCTVRTH